MQAFITIRYIHERELRVLPEPVQRAIDLDEDFLRDVFGIVVVAGELIGDAIHHRSMPLDERLKSGCVAARRAGNQIRISHSSACRARARAGSERVPASDGWSCQGYDAAARLGVDRGQQFGARGSGFGARTKHRAI